MEANETQGPCGLMDKASDFESEDGKFESCLGRIILFDQVCF